MARIAKLNQAQVSELIEARPHTTIAKLSKHYGISESSVYKVLNGTYAPRDDGMPAPRRMRRRNRRLSTIAGHSLTPQHQTTVQSQDVQHDLAAAAAVSPTPSLFHAEAPAAPRMSRRRQADSRLVTLLRQFQLTPEDLDPVSLAAAEVLAARARFKQTLRTQAHELPA